MRSKSGEDFGYVRSVWRCLHQNHRVFLQFALGFFQWDRGGVFFFFPFEYNIAILLFRGEAAAART